MGLDMYLYRKSYCQNWNHHKPEERFDITILRGGGPFLDIDTTKIAYVIEQIGYWRKANAVHKFFVDIANGVDDCQEIPVSFEQLVRLHELCQQVIRECPLVPGVVTNGYTLTGEGRTAILEQGLVVANPERAEELLPTQEGFFFGSTEYNQWYIQDIRDTVEILAPYVGKETDAEFYYRASW